MKEGWKRGRSKVARGRERVREEKICMGERDGEKDETGDDEGKDRQV